jgi:hypothetical protein
MREIALMMSGTTLWPARHMFVAHLLTECNSLTEYCGYIDGVSTSNDYGWSVGIPQYHFCYSFASWLKEKGFRCGQRVLEVRKAFWEEFKPEWKEWRAQISYYIKDMEGRLMKYGSAKSAIDSWNAHPDYVARVLSRVAFVKALVP